MSSVLPHQGESVTSPMSPSGTITSIFRTSGSQEEMVSRLRHELGRRIDGQAVARVEEIKDPARNLEWNANAIVAVFESVRKQPDGKISLDAFAEEYIAQYSQIQNKYDEIDMKYKEVEVELTAATVSLQQARTTERMNPETGISQNEHGGSLGRLEVTLVDARNLASMDYSGTSDPFVVLSVESASAAVNKVMCGDPVEQKSQIKWKDLNPRWDEAFCFKPIYRKDAVLVIRVYDKDPVLKDELMGLATIPFQELLDQLKHDIWKQLRNDPSHTSNAANPTRAKGSIHVKAQFLYSQVEYFEGCVQKQKQARERLSAEKMEAQSALAQLQAPFGQRISSSGRYSRHGARTKLGGGRAGGGGLSPFEFMSVARWKESGSENSFLIPGGSRVPQHQCFWCCTRCLFCMAIIGAIAVVLAFTFGFGRGNDKSEFDQFLR